MSDKRTLTRLKYIHGRFILFGMMFTSLAQGAEKLFVMTSEAIARIASVTVESMMNLTYQTVMRSCYRPGKILFDDLMIGGNECRPDALGKGSFSSEARSAE